MRFGCSGRTAAGRFIPAFAAALVALWAQGVGAQEARPQSPQSAIAAPAPARSAPHAALFDAVVTEIANRFYDVALLDRIGWRRLAGERREAVADAPTRAEAVQRINAMLAELKTSHTQLYTPEDIEFYILADVFGRADALPEVWGAPPVVAGIGAYTARIEERTFVDAILEGSPAEKAGLKTGDEIVMVDGAPYAPVASFRGKAGGSVVLSIRREREGGVAALTVPVVLMQPGQAFTKATRNSTRVIERGGRRYGYVHLWAIREEELLAAEIAKIDPLRRTYRTAGGGMTTVPGPKDLPPLDGLIIDNRVKVGGQTGVASHYVRVLAGEGGYRLTATGRSARSAAAPPRQAPVAMLIDHRSRSAAELLAYGFRNARLGPLIGARTAGAVSAANVSSMPGGLLLYVAVTGLRVDGEILEGQGVAPDIAIERTLPYSNGADPVLDAAIEHLSRR